MSLTDIISSSLLYYRLLSYQYSQAGYGENAAINGDAPIASVWQIKVSHAKTDASIIFMNDYGLFDIRADEDAKEVMGDIVAFTTALCKDRHMVER